jgi:hypothetical protein
MRSERGQASVEWVALVLLLAVGLAALSRLAPRADPAALGPELIHAIGCAARGGCSAEPDARAGGGSRAPGRTRGSDLAPGGGPPPGAGLAPGHGVQRAVTVPPLVPIPLAERGTGAAGPRARVPRAPSPPLAERGTGAAGPRPRVPRALPAPLARRRSRFRVSPPAPLARPRPRFRVPPLGPFARRARREVGLLWRRSWMLCLGYERVRYSVLHPEIRFPHQTIPLSEDLRIANDCLSPVDLVRDWDLIRGRP